MTSDVCLHARGCIGNAWDHLSALCFLLSCRDMVALLTLGGAIPARRSTFSTDVRLRHPVMDRQHIAMNATKSQLLYFSYLDKDHRDLLNLTMKDGNVIPYVSKYWHIGTTIYTTLYRDDGIDVVEELYKRTNYMLSDFCFTESCSVSN